MTVVTARTNRLSTPRSAQQGRLRESLKRSKKENMTVSVLLSVSLSPVDLEHDSESCTGPGNFQYSWPKVSQIAPQPRQEAKDARYGPAGHLRATTGTIRKRVRGW